MIHSSYFNLNATVGGMMFSYAVSLLLVCVGLFFGWMWKVSETPWSDRENGVAQERANSPISPKMVCVGRITGMIDCEFSLTGNLYPPSPNAFVPLGRKYKLESGLLEISYDTGAKVILQGPAVYEAASANGGVLSYGKLTALVDRSKSKATIDSLPLNDRWFSIQTPLAVVRDLGTEFGVECDASGATQSHVFQGRVELRVVTADGRNGQTVSLRENESARVEIGQHHNVKVTRNPSKEKESSVSFVRRMPKPLVFDFDDGTDQGWAPIPGLVGDEVISFHVIDDSVPYHPSPAGQVAQSPSCFISQFTTQAAQDRRDSPHRTATLQSPPFVLEGWGSLSVYLFGGYSGGLLGTNVSEIPKNTKEDGFQGVALERVSDGALVLVKSRGFGGNDWLRVSFSVDELAPYVGKGLYRLVLIDNKHGEWGWIELDSVSIPGSLAATTPPSAQQTAKTGTPDMNGNQ